MKTSDLENKLVWIFDRLWNSFSWKWFVSRDILEEIQISLWDIVVEIRNEGIQVSEVTVNWMQLCWSCHQKVSLRKKRINRGIVSWLIKCFNFVMKDKLQWFQISEIDLTPQEYAELNHLVRFWLLYKSEGMKAWEYWVPRKTVSKFLKWEWRVAEYYETDPTKKEWEDGRRTMSEKRILISEVPSIKNLRDQFGDHLTEYVWNEDFE